MSGVIENCVLFFVKYPAVGRVKTRLAKQLGRKAASDLYKNFVNDILAMLNNLNVSLKIFFDPPDTKKQIQQWLGEKYSYAPQIGQGLGQRMKNAFLQVFSEGFKSVIIIGSDSPDLPAEYLGLAFKALDRNDTVIGPSSDGGYYLIGFTRHGFSPEVFNQICWSSEKVFEQTVNELGHRKHSLYLLPQWHDIDTAVDLDKLIKRSRGTAFERSKTFISAQKIRG
jgi:rSAM/selenodomain-associated transferase 1